MFLGSKVLDIGCSGRLLKSYLGEGIEYVGLDINPPADLLLDLDKNNLPFPENHFHSVICTDVLEHLERFYEIFDEICRVTRGVVILSLPNPYMACKKILVSRHPRLKFYGLPVERPGDRHRWFFGPEDVVRFLFHRASRQGAQAIHVAGFYQGHPYMLTLIRLMAAYHPAFLNVSCAGVWAKIDFGCAMG